MVACGFVSAAYAQAYPNRPIRMLVTVAAGGPIDTIARLIAEQMQPHLNQPIIVENRAGAGGTVGVKAASTLQTFAIAPALYQNPGYDPAKFVPIGLVAEFPFVMVVPAQVPAKTLKEFVAFAKTTSEKLSFGGSLATPAHLLGELFKRTNDIDIVYVPYRGLAPSIGDLISGRTHMAFDAAPSLLPLIKEGKLRPLAVLSATRSPFLPDVPTMAESGMPGFPGSPWTAIAVPPGTPEPIVRQLNGALNAALNAPETRERMEKLMLSPIGGSGRDLSGRIAQDAPKWREIVIASGAKAE
jgi:tripartite-type tricarboxylate transporter receptor subunit TctC